MRRKVSLILIIALCAILTLTLFACGPQAQDPSKLPETVEPDVTESEDSGEVDTYLSITTPTQATSVFKSIYIDEFDLSQVKYCVIRTNGKITVEGQKGSVTEDMLDDASKELIKQAGRHQIQVSLTLEDGTVAKGSFDLNLMARVESTPKVTLTFVLNKGIANFGSTGADGTKATVEVNKGTTFTTWYDFAKTFPMRSSEGKALSGVKIASKEYNQTNFSTITLNQDTTINVLWTDNTYNVNFKLCVPGDASLMSGVTAPDAVFSQTVVRGGCAIAPKTETLNVYDGYYFAGWYLDVNGNGAWDESDSAWSFSKPVTENNLTLVGRWTMRSYSFTLYTMGGGIAENTANSIIEGLVITSDEIAQRAGVTVIDTTSRFSLKEGELQSIVMSGFAYGHNYSEYVMKVNPSANSDKVLYLTLDDIIKALVKGNKDYIKVEDVYSDYQCQNKANITDVRTSADGSDGVGYIKWIFNDPDKSNVTYAQERLERLSGYYTNVLFKDGISLKADGSVRLDKIADESVNEIIIPSEIVFNGATRPITEISQRACMNLKALVKIDMSDAKNLTVIGQEAFKHCPYLSEVILPDGGSIKQLGKEIFSGSAFENNYSQGSAIIVNNVLYKYVARDASVIESLDLTTSEFENVTRISNGAFADCANLKTITFGNSVTTIDNGAFANLANLANLHNTSALTYVGESAFDGTKIVTSQSNCLQSGNSVIIGNIFYRFIDKDATSATIPDGVKHIAPSAFLGCANVENIAILGQNNIESIGKGAFSGTKWMQRADNSCLVDGFIVVNGILCDYPGNKGENLSIPSSGNLAIIEDAFYSSAQAVKTIKFDSNVKRIDDYAFRGMTIAESFIFSNVTVNDNGLVGAPAISQNAFADSDGKLINNAKFFFTSKVINYFKDLASGAKKTTDATTLSWYSLYELNTANFIAEQIDSVWIDTKTIPSVVLNTGDDQSKALEALYTQNPTLFNNALVVMGNTGVVRRENLSITNNQVTLVKIVEGDSAFGALYAEGVDKYVVKFTYADSTDGCHINANDSHLFVLTVVNAVKGAPQFYSSDIYAHNNTVANLDGKNSGNYYIAGFDGQKSGAAVPTFYTSFDSANNKFTFKYIDVLNNEHVCNVKVSGFAVNNTKTGAVAEFAVDFYGIGEYRFKLSYNVEQAKIIDFEQVGAISIPLNSNASEAMSRFYAELIGEDGERELVALTSNNGFSVINGSIDTTKLGMHTLDVRYLTQKVDSALTGTLVYSVVLEADESLFSYEIMSEDTARIISCSAKSADTIVIPETCTIGDNTYKVTRIGANGASKGVFEDFNKLKAIYLTSNVQYISNNTFKDCTLLENVYTAEAVSVDFAPLTKVNWAEIGDTTQTGDAIYHNVKVVNLDEIELATDNGKKVLAIGAQYIEYVSGIKHVYTVTAYSLNIDEINVEVFLPDTIQAKGTLTDKSGIAIEPNMYSSQSNAMFRTATSVASNLVEIGANAFSGCTSLKSIDFSKATKLDYIATRAFAESGIENIDLSATAITDINNQTFEGCLSLVSVKLSDKVEAIGVAAFKNCAELTTIIASGVTSVDATAYEQANKLTSAPGLN